MEKHLFACNECGLYYREKKKAKQCEKWCKKYHSCNLEVIKHAVHVVDKGENGS